MLQISINLAGINFGGPMLAGAAMIRGGGARMAPENQLSALTAPPFQAGRAAEAPHKNDETSEAGCRASRTEISSNEVRRDELGRQDQPRRRQDHQAERGQGPAVYCRRVAEKSFNQYWGGTIHSYPCTEPHCFVREPISPISRLRRGISPFRQPSVCAHSDQCVAAYQTLTRGNLRLSAGGMPQNRSHRL